MRKLIVAEFITFDGVIQALALRTKIPMVVGRIRTGMMKLARTSFKPWRKTWQEHGAAFDSMPEGDPFGDVMKSKKKYVVSTTLKSTSLWRNSTIINGNVVGEVRKLKEQPGQNILLDDSSVLVHTLIENDLVDEYALHVYPLVLGGGKKLFTEKSRVNLKLIESTALPTGVVFQRYQPVR